MSSDAPEPTGGTDSAGGIDTPGGAPAPARSRAPVDQPAIDWATLRETARAMLDRSYSPYSRVRVGAAALVDDGRIVGGANVENASYGLSLCAECSLVSDLARTGGGRLIAFTVVGGDGSYLAPCGRCRQLLFEFGGPSLQMDLGDRIATLDEMLPGAFGPDDLPARSGD